MFEEEEDDVTLEDPVGPVVRQEATDSQQAE